MMLEKRIIFQSDDYKPTKHDINSSDSNTDLDWENNSDSESDNARKKVELTNIRDKSWKKKRTTKKFRKNPKTKTPETDHL